MIKFEQTKRAENLGKDSLRAAARDIKALEKGPAWFRVCQELEAERERYHTIFYMSPKSLTPVDYAEATGALNMIDRFYRILDSIIEEGKEDTDK